MDHTTNVNNRITVGPQPTVADLAQLESQGFKTIVNFRHGGEDHLPLSPEAEGEQVEKLGMAYLHIPVSMKSITPALVDQFRREFGQRPEARVCALQTRHPRRPNGQMNAAIEQGLSGRQAIQKASDLGFDAEKPETEQFVTDYVDSRSALEVILPQCV
jgi:uncharacterized protein (TIGR01244 family)